MHRMLVESKQQHGDPSHYTLSGGFIIPASCYSPSNNTSKLLWKLSNGCIHVTNRQYFSDQSQHCSVYLTWQVSRPRRRLLSLPSLSLLASRSVCWHGGRFSVNLKGIAEKRACSRIGDAVIGCGRRVLCCPWSLLRRRWSPRRRFDRRSEGQSGRPPGELASNRAQTPTMRLPVKLSPNSIRGRGRRSPKGQTAPPATTRRSGAVPRRFRFFLSFCRSFSSRLRRWLALPCSAVCSVI